MESRIQVYQFESCGGLNIFFFVPIWRDMVIIISFTFICQAQNTPSLFIYMVQPMVRCNPGDFITKYPSSNVTYLTSKLTVKSVCLARGREEGGGLTWTLGKKSKLKKQTNKDFVLVV